MIFFSLWALLVLLAPLTLPTGSVVDLSGHPGSLDNADPIGDMNPFAATIYLLGDVYCHQIVERSFFINGNEMPFCARDIGIFLGLVIGMILVIALSPRFNLLILAALVIPLLIDGGVQYAGFHESDNLTRLITGLMAGMGCSYILGHIADRALNTEVRP